MTKHECGLHTVAGPAAFLPLVQIGIRQILALTAMLFLASASLAQQAAAVLSLPEAWSDAKNSAPATTSNEAPAHKGSNPPKWGIFAGYSSIETNNHNFHFKPDINAFALDYDENGHGFEIGGVRNLNRYFGIVGLFDAHFSSNGFALGVVPLGGNQFTFVLNCSQPPCTAQTFHLDPSLFRFTAGPEVAFRNWTRMTPFADVLFGVAHSHATFRTAGPALTLSRIETENGFAVNFAAGLEFRLVHQLSFRGSIDYGKAFVGSSALPSQLVDSVGFSAGILFRFH